ncbi:MAG: UvrD-helicase domain-containing protein [Rikenellaceae bacterium]
MKASIYNASAGSGKTYRLAYKYVRDVVEEPQLYRNILAVTFTNKATEEMKRRILQQIHTLAAGQKSSYLNSLMEELGKSEAQVRHNAMMARTMILHDYSRFTILTIDTFFQRVLRAFIQELGIDIGYNLEIESSTIVTQGADALIEQITTDKALRKWLMAFVQERIDEGRKWDVREGILSLSGELFDEQAREALESSMSKEELMGVIADEARKAKERADALQSLGVRAMEIITSAGLTCDDFKYKDKSGVQIFRKVAAGELPEIGKRNLDWAESEDLWCTKKSDAIPLVPLLQPLLREIIERYNDDHKVMNTSKLLRENYRSFALLADLYRTTQQICQEQNTMLLNQTSRILEEFIRENDAPFIYEKVGNKFSRFMIDEFQDTSRREWNNFLPLLRNTISQSTKDQCSVLIVGDIKQSIYRWRGGDWRILRTDAQRELGEGDTEVINMDDNYRSLPNIVNFNNEIISQVVKLENVELGAELATAYNNETISKECFKQLNGVLPRAYEGHAQTPQKRAESDGFVEILTYEDEPPIMDRICDAIDRGFKPCDIMILTRSNPQATNIAQILLAFKRQSEDPKYRFDVMTQQALIVGYAPVSQFIIAVLRLALNPDDTLQRAIYNKFLKRSHLDNPIEDRELKLLSSIRMFAPIEAFEMIVMEYDLDQDVSNIAYLQAIHEQIIAFSNNRIGDIALFLEWWEQKGSTKSLNVERSENAIEIMTIHKAKGLEKKVVIIPYCNWSRDPRTNSIVWAEGRNDSKIGAFPIHYKNNMANSEFAEDYFREKVYSHIDSVNMLYVALTRAVESLHIFIPTKVSKSGERIATNIGKLLLDSIPDLATQPHKVTDDQYISYQFGKLAKPTKGGNEEESSEPLIMDQYKSSPTELHLRMPSKRYREDDEFAPREVGILMHKAFEQASSREQIFSNVETMLKNGHINAIEHKLLLHSIEEALQEQRAVEWFDGEWDQVRNECEIIRPGSDGSRRPDRVMIKGDRAVIVDYKFGEIRSKNNIRQMERYISLMRDMGYRDVEGYIWYIRQGEIVTV